MKKQFKPLIIYTFLSLFIFFSCTKEASDYYYGEEDLTYNQLEKTKPVNTHNWYYFTKDSFKQIDLPQNAPQVLLKPWTESTRISSSLTIKTDTSKEGEQSYFTVNKSGLFLCTPRKSQPGIIIQDAVLFNSLSSDEIFCVNGNPVLHMYKNRIFDTKYRTSHPFLVLYEPSTKMFVPLLYNTDINIADEAEITEIKYDNSIWTLAVKNSKEDKSEFQYLQFASYELLQTIPANKRKEAIQSERLTQSEFRAYCSPKSFSTAPQRVKELLKRLPDDYPFFAECSVANRGSQIVYEKDCDNAMKNFIPKIAKVILDDTCTFALFSDGTVFFSGALRNRHVLNNGASLAFRLPKLPKGYVYSSCIISDDILYASWEETDFYKSGRTGFLTVDLLEVLYKTE